MSESETERPAFPPLLTRAEEGDSQALAELDSGGLPVAPGEDLAAYAERLRGLFKRLEAMEKTLAEAGEFVCEDLRLRAEDRIPVDLLRQSTQPTLTRYGCQADWVPGFFVNPSFSWLFGGCAYYFYPEMFALMIVRRTFARHRKWFIYDRQEILAHEMCHVDRLCYLSSAYEERFAYRISESGFRRRFGGVFESPRDSFLLLGSTLALLAAQVVRTMFWWGLPIWPFWLGIAGVFGFLAGRDRIRHRTLRRAENNLAQVKPKAWLDAILFRCTDREVEELARLKDQPDCRLWLERKVEGELRWRVIADRFFDPAV